MRRRAARWRSPGRWPRERLQWCARHGRRSGQLRAEIPEHLPPRVGVEARVAVMRVVVRKREGSDGHASENECHEEREVAVPSYRLNRWRRWRLVHPTKTEARTRTRSGSWMKLLEHAVRDVAEAQHALARDPCLEHAVARRRWAPGEFITTCAHVMGRGPEAPSEGRAPAGGFHGCLSQPGRDGASSSGPLGRPSTPKRE